MVRVYRDRSMIRYESLVNFKIESQTKKWFSNAFWNQKHFSNHHV